MTTELPARFLPPAGWRTHSFTNDQTGHRIFYGSVFPQREEPPSAVVVCLGGLSEFMEKYYELAHDMLDRGFAFWFIDWQYQGRSGRLKSHPHRRHSDGFDADVSDLHKLVSDYIKPSSVHPDRGRIPMVMIGHSMGANIGLRFLSEYPKFFDGAAFSAPFLGIYDFNAKLRFIASIVKRMLPVVGKGYVFGGRDWHETMRRSDGTDIFSSDPVRDSLHNYWCRKDNALKVGNVTFGWVIKALESCALLKNPDVTGKINIPVLVAVAGDDRIVDNNDTRAVAALLANARIIEIPGARHEILMEKDEYRNQFLNAFDNLVKEHKIASEDNIKPF